MFKENGYRHNDPANMGEFFFPTVCRLDLGPKLSLGTGGLFPPSIHPGSEADLSHMHVAVWYIIKHRDKFI